MLAVTDDVVQALRSTQTGVTRGVARYGTRSAALQLDQSGSLSFSSDGDVQASASGVQVIGSHTPSLVPQSDGDLLATAGQEVALYRDVKIGDDVVTTIALGQYRIQSAGDSTERYRDDVAVDWSVSLDLKDRFEPIIADDFLAPDGPVAGNTVWDEIRRLSPIPVQQALGDAPVPAGTVYDSRIGAIDALLQILGGDPRLTRAGVLTATAKDSWLAEPDPVFQIPAVIGPPSRRRSNDFYNAVQVSNPQDSSVVGYAQIDDLWNPLCVARAGRRVYKQSTTIYDTADAAQAAAETLLARVSTKRARTIQLQCLPEALLLDLGDFVEALDPLQHRRVTGEVTALSVPFDATQTVPVTLTIARDERYVPPTVIDLAVFFDVGPEAEEGLRRIVRGDELIVGGSTGLYGLTGKGLKPSEDDGLYDVE
jgi:hypothetical protein